MVAEIRMNPQGDARFYIDARCHIGQLGPISPFTRPGPLAGVLT